MSSACTPQQKYEILYNRFLNEPPYDFVGLVVYRNRKTFPSDNEVRIGVLQAVIREIEQGVKTIVFPKSKPSR